MNKLDRKEYDKKYTERNKEKRKLYLELNKEKIAKAKKIYSENNKDKVCEWQKEWQKNNKNKIRLNHQNRLKTDKLYQLKKSITSNIKSSFKRKGFIKLSHTEQILGCMYADFKNHLESQFKPWMNWDNYGNPKDGILELNKTWDIDHIIALATAQNEFDIIKLNHYTNLQPLCSYTNRWVKRNN